MPEGVELTEAAIRSHWLAQRNIVEFLAAQPGSRYWIAEAGERARRLRARRPVRRDGGADRADGRSRAPARRASGARCSTACWPGDPTPDLGRVVVATGAPARPDALPGLRRDAGDRPLAPARAHRALPRAARAGGGRARARHARARPAARGAEWQRLEPLAIAHERPALHEFFARDRTCLATVSPDGRRDRRSAGSPRRARSGPRSAASPEDLVPVVLAALDRVAKTQEPEELSLFCTTIAWWLLRRLRGLGFHVYWPSWVMCSMPAARARQVCTDAARRTYSEGMAESLKDLAGKGLALLVLLVRGVPPLQGRRSASSRHSSGSLIGIVALVAVIWALGAAPLGGVLRLLFLLRPLGRDHREDQGQLVLHLVPDRLLPAADRDDRSRSCGAGRRTSRCAAARSAAPIVPVYDQVCMSCGKDLDYPEEVFTLDR